MTYWCNFVEAACFLFNTWSIPVRTSSLTASVDSLSESVLSLSPNNQQVGLVWITLPFVINTALMGHIIDDYLCK